MNVEANSDSGCILGVAVGDAIGEIAQHQNWSTIDWDALKSRPGVLTYTDDTAMCIGVMESMIDRGRIDVESLGARFHQNWAMEPGRGYGDGPPTIFSVRESRSVTYRRATALVNKVLHGGAGSYGDGAAMHVQPIGLFMRHRFSPSDFARAARRSALVTHRNPIAVDGAVVVALSVRFAAMTSTPPVVDRDPLVASVMKEIKTQDMRRGLLHAVEYASSDLRPDAIASVVSGEVSDTTHRFAESRGKRFGGGTLPGRWPAQQNDSWDNVRSNDGMQRVEMRAQVGTDRRAGDRVRDPRPVHLPVHTSQETAHMLAVRFTRVERVDPSTAEDRSKKTLVGVHDHPGVPGVFPRAASLDDLNVGIDLPDPCGPDRQRDPGDRRRIVHQQDDPVHFPASGLDHVLVTRVQRCKLPERESRCHAFHR